VGWEGSYFPAYVQLAHTKSFTSIDSEGNRLVIHLHSIRPLLLSLSKFLVYKCHHVPGGVWAGKVLISLPTSNSLVVPFVSYPYIALIEL
jgi:hypothetical protein